MNLQWTYTRGAIETTQPNLGSNKTQFLIILFMLK